MMTADVYCRKFEEVEKQLREFEEIRWLCKWAKRTGDEPDVVDRDEWKAKIEWAREELKKRRIV